MEPLPPRKPPSFPAPPKSALFDRLEAFLPKLASENKKLEDAIASGDGDRHNIEVPVVAGVEKAEENESDDEDEDGDVAMEDDAAKPPVIEMNFALGLMEEGGSDSDSDSDEEEEAAVDLATILATRKGDGEDQKANGISLTTEKPTQAARPLIQELN